MFSYTYDHTGERTWSLRNIEPVDVKIYYEGKKPYIDYLGEAISTDGMKMKVHIPKIGLNFNEFLCKEKHDICHGLILNFKMEAFATSSEDILFTITEKELTKDQINMMAGCQVKIVEK